MRPLLSILVLSLVGFVLAFGQVGGHSVMGGNGVMGGGTLGTGGTAPTFIEARTDAGFAGSSQNNPSIAVSANDWELLICNVVNTGSTISASAVRGTPVLLDGPTTGTGFKVSVYSWLTTAGAADQ